MQWSMSNSKSAHKPTSLLASLTNGRKQWAARLKSCIRLMIYGFNLPKAASGQPYLFSAMVKMIGVVTKTYQQQRTVSAGNGLSDSSGAGVFRLSGVTQFLSKSEMQFHSLMRLSMSGICVAPCLALQKTRSLIIQDGNLSDLEIRSWIARIYHFPQKMTYLA